MRQQLIPDGNGEVLRTAHLVFHDRYIYIQVAVIKLFEILGGVLVAAPKTRNFGLLILGPILVNILCFHIFLTKGATLIDPVNFLMVGLALFLLWSGRRAFCGLLND